MSINFWWVNHKQTHKEEIEGGYIWSPKTKSNGARNETYLNLPRTAPGDVVFSYASTAIRCVGVVSGPCVDAPKPSDFGQAGQRWSDAGWLVPVTWTRLEVPLVPRENMERIKDRLPKKNSPIRADGNGNEACYLAALSQELGEELIKLLNRTDAAIESETLATSDDAIADEIERKLLEDGDLHTTEVDQVVKARRGQGLYRLNLMDVETRCRVTGVGDKRFLVASHIKPWKDCQSSGERLDGHNGLLLAPHVDRLFDHGWISFGDDGALLSADPNTRAVLSQWGISVARKVGAFSARQKEYLRFHREKVFARRLASQDAPAFA